MILQTVLLLALAEFSLGATLWSWSHESHAKDIHAVLKDSFEYSVTQGQFGIGADESLSIAPSPSHDGTYVMRVFYQKGSYSGSCHGGNCHRGAQFYAQPQAVSGHTTLTLEYEIWFDETFSWNKGGKLPGLWGGSRDCSGGRLSDTCFSTRLMWRRLGDGEVYAYVTHNQQPSFDHFCNDNDHLTSSEKYKQIHCTPTTGIELGSGSFRFQHSKWHKIRQEVHLNSVSDQPGYVKLWVDDHAEIHVTNIIMRHSNAFAIDGLFFSTFYGGGDSSWACPHDTYTYYRNFRISTDTHAPSTSQLVG